MPTSTYRRFPTFNCRSYSNPYTGGALPTHRLCPHSSTGCAPSPPPPPPCICSRYPHLAVGFAHILTYMYSRFPHSTVGATQLHVQEVPCPPTGCVHIHLQDVPPPCICSRYPHLAVGFAHMLTYRRFPHSTVEATQIHVQEVPCPPTGCAHIHLQDVATFTYKMCPHVSVVGIHI